MSALQLLRRAGLVSALDEHFARAVTRIAAEQRTEVQIAAALASRFTSRGHVCLELARARSIVSEEDGVHIERLMELPDTALWQAALRDSPVVGRGDPPSPLVCDDHGRVYLWRYWDYERRLATLLRERACLHPDPVDAELLRDGLRRLFPDANGAGPNQQRVAAAVAVLRKLSVLSGGPGTGKTRTVVRVVALLLELAHARGQSLRIALLAPTGKAAARLIESVRDARTHLPCDERVLQGIPEQASTLHRALLPLRASSHHGPAQQLAADVIVVDEASMVDLGLMTRLLESAPTRARIILLGDADQLASVEAGAILGDICHPTAGRSLSPALAMCVREAASESVPEHTAKVAESPMADSIVRLDHSHRSKGEGLTELAVAIRSGRAHEVLDVLGEAKYTGAARVDLPGGGRWPEALTAAVLERYGSLSEARSDHERLVWFDRFRILCAHRRGPYGVESINNRVERTLSEAGLLELAGTWYAGRPVMVLRNDYQLGLYNGDVGFIGTVGESDELRAVFPGSGEQLRSFAPSRLPAHETVFAMTVHKSQGSEFDEVAVLLPDHISPLLSRELLYTAVSRARWKVTVYGNVDVISAAVRRRIDRASGLRDRLWDSDKSL